MGRALKYGHRWPTSVGRRWKEEEDIWQGRSHRERGRRKEKGPTEKERGPWDARGVGDSSHRARVPFSLEPLGRPIMYVFPPQNKPSPYQGPTSGPTLYKFIVMGSVRKPWPHNIYIYTHFLSLKFRVVYVWFNLHMSTESNINY